MSAWPRLGKLARIAAGAAVLLAAGCGERPAPASPEAVRVAIGADIRGTDPGVTRDSNTDTVLHHVVESLVAYSERMTVEPLLARDVQVSPDGRQYRFRLRDGILFHNGAPLTSAEVKWSWERMLDPATGFRCRSWYDGTAGDGVGARIVSIDTPDRDTVVFNLDRPNSAFLDEMASLQCITAILHPDSVGPDGKWRGPVGTGPYRIAVWRRGEYVELEKFARYRSRPGVRDGYAGARVARAPRIRFLIVPEPSVGLSAIEAGDLDVLPRVPPYLTANLRRTDIAVARSPQLQWHVLLIQTGDPLLRDLRLRRAIAKAISADQVAAIATYGSASANPSAIPRISRFHSSAQNVWWAYDPAGARALLAEAGYRGQPIRIQTNRKLPFAFDNAVAIQAMLNAVGINAQLEVLDWTTQLSNYFEGKFQLSVFSYSARAHPVLSYAAFVGSKRRNTAAQWDDPEARLLLDAATRAPTDSEQQPIYDNLHRLMVADVPIIGLYNEPSSDLVRAGVHGYRNWPAGNPRLWGVWRTGS